MNINEIAKQWMGTRNALWDGCFRTTFHESGGVSAVVMSAVTIDQRHYMIGATNDHFYTTIEPTLPTLRNLYVHRTYYTDHCNAATYNLVSEIEAITTMNEWRSGRFYYQPTYLPLPKPYPELRPGYQRTDEFTIEIKPLSTIQPGMPGYLAFTGTEPCL